jgi:hypothetical protein
MSNQYVKVSKGRTRGGIAINDTAFKLLETAKTDKDGLYIVVDGTDHPELRAGRNRIYLEESHYAMIDTLPVKHVHMMSSDSRSDTEISRDLIDTFKILGEMTDAVASSVVRGLVVSGPAGIGKSYTVESTLVKSLDMLGLLSGKGSMYDTVSGHMSPIALYETLWNYRDEGKVLLFDDCDSVLYDEDSLNILKAALDSKKTRKISWNTNSRYLIDNDIPKRFEYQGGIIFITNLKFDQVRSHRISNHLEAIVSRCHYMDLGIDTPREKMIHIHNVFARSDMLRDYNFTDDEKRDVIAYMDSNYGKLRELSLRMVLKIADLRKAMPHNWIKFVEKNCHKRAA